MVERQRPMSETRVVLDVVTGKERRWWTSCSACDSEGDGAAPFPRNIIWQGVNVAKSHQLTCALDEEVVLMGSLA